MAVSRGGWVPGGTVRFLAFGGEVASLFAFKQLGRSPHCAFCDIALFLGKSAGGAQSPPGTQPSRETGGYALAPFGGGSWVVPLASWTISRVHTGSNAACAGSKPCIRDQTGPHVARDAAFAPIRESHKMKQGSPSAGRRQGRYVSAVRRPLRSLFIW